MRTTKAKVAVSVLGVVVLALIVRSACTSLPSPSDVSVTLLGYTNDSVGGPLAVIAVANRSSGLVQVYRPTIQILAPTAPHGFTNYFQGNTNQWARFNSRLVAGSSATFTIPPPPPAYQASWRMSFLVDSDFGLYSRVKRFVTGRRQMPSELNGRWIEDGQ